MFETLLAVLPIIILLVCLLGLKMTAMKSGAWAFCTALMVFFFYYKPGVLGMSISMAKGFGLALFVILIIWGAMFLYNMVKEVGALEVINRNIKLIIQDKFIQFILLSWIFSAFLQGIAGFGVPVIVVTPLLIGIGFDPVASVAAVLVGHSWAISFGSMGSSIYAINMVTETGISEIVIFMAIFGVIAMFCTGLSVCYIYGGLKTLVKGLPYIAVLTICMGAVLYLLAKLEMLSVIGLLTGLTGLITCSILYKIKSRKNNSNKIPLYKDKINLLEALLPYLLIVVLSLAFYVIDPSLSFGFDFNGYVTELGHKVVAENDYVSFNLLKFPFSIIMLSSFICMTVYRRKKIFDRKSAGKIIKATINKCIPTTITIVFLLNMAVIMMDSGMIEQIAHSLVGLAGDVYPLVAPFIGLLGAFVTGSNTNSNIIFGNLQEIAAMTIGISTALICGVQSIGASVGGGIGPTTVSLGATAAHIQGEEGKIYKKTLGPIIITTFVLGIACFLIVNFY